METIFFGLCVCITGNFGVRKYNAMYRVCVQVSIMIFIFK